MNAPAKKAPAKRAAAKKTAAAPAPADALATIREDTPNPETTDLDRDPDSVCRYCGRDADTDGMCAKHAARRGADA